MATTEGQTLSQAGRAVKRSGPALFEVIADADADRAAWLQARRALVAASEVPAVLGICPGKGRIWYEKAGLLVHQEGEAEYATFGKLSEDFHAQTLYARATGRRLRRVQKLLRSTRYPWLGATLDYEIVRFPAAGSPVHLNDGTVAPWTDVDWPLPAPVELKSTGRKSLWPDDEEPDLKWQAQLQAQMLVVGSTWGSLSAIIGQPWFHHRWCDYPRHDGFCAQIAEQSERFLESVRAGNPPVDDTEDTAQALRQLQLDPRRIRLPAIASEWTEKAVEARQRVLEAEREERYYRNLIGTALGTADEGELADGTVWEFKVHHRKGYTVEPKEVRELKWKPGN